MFDNLYSFIRESVKNSRFSKRSNEWPRVRKEFLKQNPECAVCGKRTGLNVHHIVPFHIAPSKELYHSNLITLCRRHHLLFGHLGLWKSWNEDVLEDCWVWRHKLRNRPK